VGEGYCFDETAFIEYLNIAFPNKKSVLIEILGWIENEKDIPNRYRGVSGLIFKDCILKRV